MGLPWYKSPTDEDFCLHAIGPLNENYYTALLRIKGRGQLDQPLNHIHIPQFHTKLTSWVAKLIGITKQRAVKLKETLLLHGLIDDYWQPLEWEQRYGPGAYRHGEGSTDKAPSSKEPTRLTDEERRKKEEEKKSRDAVRQRRHREKKKDGVTDHVTGNVTGVTPNVTGVTPNVTDHVTGVTPNVTVTRPENSSKNLLKNQEVTRNVTDSPLDIDIDKDLDTRNIDLKNLENLKATSKSIALPPGSANQPGSAREYRVTFTLPPQPHPADPLLPVNTDLPGAVETIAEPDSHLTHVEASSAPANGSGKGIIHDHPNNAKNDENTPVSDLPPKSRPAVAHAAPVNESGKTRKKELTQEQKNLNATIWQRYQAAYFERYGADPVRNAKVNKQINDLRERLGHEAPDVAAFYVGINDGWLIKTSHNIGNLLQGCEGYRTQWVTGRQVNSVTARQIERTQANYNAVEEAKEMLRNGYVSPFDLALEEIKALELQRSHT